jgi:hypothetical protein
LATQQLLTNAFMGLSLVRPVPVTLVDHTGSNRLYARVGTLVLGLCQPGWPLHGPTASSIINHSKQHQPPSAATVIHGGMPGRRLLAFLHSHLL